MSRLIQSGAAGALADYAIGFPLFEDLGFFTGADFEVLRARGNKNVAVLEGHFANREYGRMRPHAHVVGFDLNSRSVFRAENYGAALERRRENRIFVVHPDACLIRKE